MWCAADKEAYDKCTVEFIPYDYYIPRKDGQPPLNSLDRTVSIQINRISSITCSVDGRINDDKDCLTDKEMNVDIDKVKKCEECKEWHPDGNWSTWKESKDDYLCMWCKVERRFAPSFVQK